MNANPNGSSAASQAKPVLHIGSVSYLNAKPLIEGLDAASDVALHLDIPAKLIDGLRCGQRGESAKAVEAAQPLDVALLPVIDYQRLDDLCIVPSGGIGCDGPTLTVRIFSSVPIDKIKTLACDTDSHTSVALARVILAKRCGIKPRFVDLPRRQSGAAQLPAEVLAADARLLIGDKVVCEEPAGFEHQLDLGQGWKELTGLPFVFAIWTARRGVDLRDLPQRLSDARELGLSRVDDIVARYAVPNGWPKALATQYLTRNLKFSIGERELQAMRLFHTLAAKYDLIPSPPRPLVVYGNDGEGVSEDILGRSSV